MAKADRSLDRRGTLLAVGAALFLVAALAYAGPAWQVFVRQFLIDGGFLALWLMAAAGIGAVALVPFGKVALGVGAVTSVALGLGVMGLTVLALGLAGWLTRTTAFALIVVGIVLLAARVARVVRETKGFEAGARAWLAAPAEWDWLWLVVVPPLAIAAVGAMVPPGMLWHPDEPHGYDVVEYHLQVPREWYEAGRIVPLTHNVFSYFPFNVEVHYLLAMHLRGGPWAGMYLAQLMHGALVVLSAVAASGFARLVAPARAGATIAAVAGAAVPWLALLAPMGYNEGGLLLYGTLAIGHALRASTPADAPLRRFALAGVMAGFACGTKLTAVPMVLLGVPAALLVDAVAARAVPLKQVVVGAVTFVAAGLLTFSPWLVRNVAWAGNPVFPEATSVLGRAHFTDVQAERWRRAHAPPPEQRPISARASAFGAEVLGNWRFGYLVVPLSVAGACLGRRGPGRWYLVTLLVGLTVFWLALTHLQGRFFVLAIPICALLIARADWGRGTAAVGAAVAVAAIVGWLGVHARFVERLHGETPWALVLGAGDFRWLNPADLQSMPPDATLVLVGDARAFWYDRPMARLRYRTVFDVDVRPGETVLDAWRGHRPPGSGEWQLVDPAELIRFSRTYWQIPPPPPDVADRRLPYVVAP